MENISQQTSDTYLSPNVTTNYSSPFQSIHNKKPHTHSIAFPSVSPFTDQSFKDECDVNYIMAQYQITGEMPRLDNRIPQYLDCSEGFDFVEMQHQVLEAKQLFSELPAVLRERFQNDPGRFIEYVQDPDNHHEMLKLGLIEKTPAVTPSPLGEAGLPASGSAPVAPVVSSTPSSP